jgi:hypothetical protein
VEDFKVGDKVIVIDASGNINAYVGQELTLSCTAGNDRSPAFKFEEVSWGLFSTRLKKVNPTTRHVHADLIIKKANDVTVVIQKLSEDDGHWYTTPYPNWAKDNRYREKPPKSQGQIKIEELKRNMTALKAQYDCTIEKLQEEVYLLNQIELNKES